MIRTDDPTPASPRRRKTVHSPAASARRSEVRRERYGSRVGKVSSNYSEWMAPRVERWQRKHPCAHTVGRDPCDDCLAGAARYQSDLWREWDRKHGGRASRPAARRA